MKFIDWLRTLLKDSAPWS